jgi:segregation and condensation protein A
MEDRVYDILMKENEVTWQDIINNLVKSEEMDPWDVDISKLTQKFIQTVKNMEKMNFFVSGKVIFASALLLRLKSSKFLDHHISEFDSYLFHTDDHEELDDFGDFAHHERVKEFPPLAVRTPQARKRRVSVKDLITALERALKIDTRRKLRLQKFFFKAPEIPTKKVDLTKLIDEMYISIIGYFKEREEVYFSELVKSDSKEDKMLTLLPLLHLDTQAKIDLDQPIPFEDIRINLKDSKH